MAVQPLSQICVLSFVFMMIGCFAQLEQQEQQLWQNLQEEQQHRLRAKTRCNINNNNNITPAEPSITFQSEAGYIQYWDSSSRHPMFECAGVEVERKVINQKGLRKILESYIYVFFFGK